LFFWRTHKHIADFNMFIIFICYNMIYLGLFLFYQICMREMCIHVFEQNGNEQNQLALAGYCIDDGKKKKNLIQTLSSVIIIIIKNVHIVYHLNNNNIQCNNSTTTTAHARRHDRHRSVKRACYCVVVVFPSR